MSDALDVLVVDDEQNMRLTLSQILTEEGFNVRTAATGEEAVELCRNITIRFILMDVRMPGIDGMEAFRQIRRHCDQSQIALMSAYSNPQLERAAMAEGALAVLTKPLDIKTIVELVRKA